MEDEKMRGIERREVYKRVRREFVWSNLSKIRKEKREWVERGEKGESLSRCKLLSFLRGVDAWFNFSDPLRR